MTIPDYQTIMLPFLKFAADEKEHKLGDAIAALAKEFNLSEEDRKILLPSGKQTIFSNRVAWSSTFLKKAGLIEGTKRGFFRITKRGITAIQSNPSKIDNNFLSQYPEFIEFRRRGHKKEEKQEEKDFIDSRDTLSPEEMLEDAFQKIQDDLSSELLTNIMQGSPAFFERLVVELLVKMGYGGSQREAARVIGQSGDEGIDGIINEDRLGLDAIYIQAKKWHNGNTVGRPEIQKFVGALYGQKARKGVFITTSRFSQNAIDYAGNIDVKIVLIDGQRLTELMIDYGVGVSTSDIYEIKKIDIDFFEEIT